MKVAKVKTARMEGKAIPIFRRMISRNANENLIKHSRNNLSELQNNELANQNFPNSLISFDNSMAFNELNRNPEDYENYYLYRKYLLSKTQYNKKISEIADIDDKLSNNNNLLKILENNLEKMVKEKKEKQLYVVDLLSKKESLEEIYNIKVVYLINTKKDKDESKRVNNNKNNNVGKDNVKDVRNDDNINESNEIIKLDDNENIIEIKVDDIKISDKKKFAEQIINFTEEILQNKNMEIRKKLYEKINMGYNIFFSEINSPSEHDIKKLIDDFFLRISVFITNQSKGKYSENLINIFLKQLLKINRINVEITEILKYLNKTYKNNKKELKDKINNLNKKNENLKNKKKSYENIKNDLKKFIDENRDKIKKNEINMINFDKDNRQYMSFILDSHLDDEFEFVFLTDSKNNKINITTDERNIPEYDADNNKTKNIPRRLKLKRALRNANNFHTALNKTSNDIRKENQIIQNLNSLIIHCVPRDKNNKKLEEHLNNKTTNEIKVKNLLINNNINIENNNIINNPTIENKDQQNIINMKSPKKMSAYFVPRMNSKKQSNNDRSFHMDNSYFNDTDMNIQLYKDLVKDSPGTFCYFKLSDKNNFNFNPLNNSGSNPIKYNYYEGYLLIDNNYDKLKITRKSEEKYISIFLKDIMNIHLSKQMINIIKIYNLYKKNGNNEDINNFINREEIRMIRMQKCEKIIAVNNKYFIFSIIMGKRFIPKVEFIFVNYEHFNLWYNSLLSISKLNNP